MLFFRDADKVEKIFCTLCKSIFSIEHEVVDL